MTRRRPAALERVVLLVEVVLAASVATLAVMLALAFVVSP